MALKDKLSILMHRWPWLMAMRQHAIMLPVAMSSLPSRAAKSYSQHGEDVRVADELRDVLATGYYVDIGANHPARLSNTYKLYCLGMRGICVEPNATLVRLFRTYRPADVALSAAIGDHDGLMRFYELSYHTLSTFSRQVADERMAMGYKIVRESFVPIFKLSTLIAACAPADRSTFALLSVDTEGFDELVLLSNDWERFRPRLIIVENNAQEAADKTGALLRAVGYEPIATFGPNSLYRNARGA